MNRGEVKTGLLIFLAIFFGIFLLWFFFNSASLITKDLFTVTRLGPRVPSSGSSVVLGGRTKAITGYEPVSSAVVLGGIEYLKSPWYGLVSLSRGNSASENNPNEEYLILSTSYRNDNAIAISGWILENGAGRKMRRGGNGPVMGVSSRVAIPQGVKLLLGTGGDVLSPIILAPGERAIVTTGNLPRVKNVTVKNSFQTNLCTGYLNEETTTGFVPTLRRDCPVPKGELGVKQLDDACYRFVSRLARCHTPETEPFRDREHELVRNHLDKVTGLSRQCRDYVLAHFSYYGCLANHLSTENFYGRDWRVFLKQRFELWDNEREVITLYDNQGRVVDQLSY